MNKIRLEFNPDYNTVREVKDAAQILRDLIQKRKQLEGMCNGDFDMISGSFLPSFDTMTQGFEVGQGNKERDIAPRSPASYDLYINGEWMRNFRTLAQCCEHVRVNIAHEAGITSIKIRGN